MQIHLAKFQLWHMKEISIWEIFFSVLPRKNLGWYKYDGLSMIIKRYGDSELTIFNDFLDVIWTNWHVMFPNCFGRWNTKKSSKHLFFFKPTRFTIPCSPLSQIPVQTFAFLVWVLSFNFNIFPSLSTEQQSFFQARKSWEPTWLNMKSSLHICWWLIVLHSLHKGFLFLPQRLPLDLSCVAVGAVDAAGSLHLVHHLSCFIRESLKKINRCVSDVLWHTQFYLCTWLLGT